MQCKNCGSTMDDNAVFCSNCGTENKLAAPAGGEYGSFSSGSAGADAPRKNKKFPIIPVVIASVIVLLIAVVGVLNFRSLRNTIRRSTSSPEKYLSHVYEDQANEGSKLLGKFYGSSIKRAKEYMRIENQLSYNLAISESAKEMFNETLGSFSGVNIDWIESIGVDITASIVDEAIGYTLNTKVNDVDIAEAKIYMNDESINVLIPTISESGLYTDAVQDSVSVSKMVSFYDDLPKQEVIEKLTRKYLLLTTDIDTDVEQSREKITAGDITVNAYAYTRELTAEDMALVAENLYNEASEDEELKDAFIQTYEAVLNLYGQSITDNLPDAEDAFDQFLTSLEEAQEVDEDMFPPVTITTYVDNSGKIIGNTVINEDETGIVENYYLIKGNKFEFLSNSTVDEEELFRLEGSGTIGSKLSGDFSVYSSESNLLNFTVKNLDLKKLFDGNLVGDFELVAGEDAENITGTLPVDLASGSLVLNAKENDVAMIVNYDEEEFLRIDVSQKTKGKAKIEEFEGDYDIETEMEDWITEVDLQPILDNLEEAGIDSDLLEQLQSMVDSL